MSPAVPYTDAFLTASATPFGIPLKCYYINTWSLRDHVFIIHQNWSTFHYQHLKGILIVFFPLILCFFNAHFILWERALNWISKFEFCKSRHKDVICSPLFKQTQVVPINCVGFCEVDSKLW